MLVDPWNRERYINPKMELELLNFKKELDRRFKNSKIKNYKFPKSEVEEHK